MDDQLRDNFAQLGRWFWQVIVEPGVRDGVRESILSCVEFRNAHELGLNPSCDRDQRAGHRASGIADKEQDHFRQLLRCDPFGKIRFGHAGTIG
jgi:hypothetical protein